MELMLDAGCLILDKRKKIRKMFFHIQHPVTSIQYLVLSNADSRLRKGKLWFV